MVAERRLVATGTSSSLLTKNNSIMEWHIVYAKFDGCKSFKAFDVKEGRQVGNLIYASLMEDTQETKDKLQKLADLNKGCHLVLQLRRNNKVRFETK